MRLIFLSICILTFTACATAPGMYSSVSSQPGIQYSGGDGTSKDSAIVITGAKGESDGVAAEYAWVKSNLPGATIGSSRVMPGRPAYDAFEVTLPSGESRDVFFDISSFFGHR